MTQLSGVSRVGSLFLIGGTTRVARVGPSRMTNRFRDDRLDHLRAEVNLPGAISYRSDNAWAVSCRKPTEVIG